MAFTDVEKSRIRVHLGYPSIGSASVLALGVPAAGHPMFLLERQMEKLLPEAEPQARAILCECDAIENQMRQARTRLGVDVSANTKFRPREELEDLLDLYAYWTDALADILAAQKNLYSSKHSGIGGYTLVES